jgi:hypothetical protein
MTAGARNDHDEKNREAIKMNEKEIFYREKNACRLPLTHITAEAAGSPLREIDALYGAADVLSVRNAEIHRRCLLALSVAGALLTFVFLLYDEAELHGLILACGCMILCLFFLHRVAKRLDCHRKYLQYRVLAECLRLQFFLSAAGVGTRVAALLPWSVRNGIPWIGQVLAELPQTGPAEKRPVLDAWVRAQKKYHAEALRKAESKDRKDRRIARGVLIVTIALYLAAMLFELLVYPRRAGAADADLIRAVLKILLGTMSAIALFSGSYYGKMSLPNVMDDHRRMIALYETAETEIRKDGEREELLLFLAREFLNENSTWYAYQSKNKPDIVI